MQTRYRLLVTTLAGILLGCGQKGPLVLPDAQHPHKKIGVGRPAASPAPSSPQPATPAPTPPAPATPAAAPDPAPGDTTGIGTPTSGSAPGSPASP